MNHKKLYLLITIGLLLLVQCEPVNQTDGSSNGEIEVVEKFIADYYNTMSERDWQTYADFFSSKGTLTTIWQAAADSEPKINTYTIAEFLDQTKDGPDSQPIFEEKPLHIEVEVTNNLANVWVKYEAKFGSQEELMEWKGYDLFSLINYKGSWKIVSIVYEQVE